MYPATVAGVIEQIESAGNHLALRFEPLTYLRYQAKSAQLSELIDCRNANKCSTETARMICSTSWGRFQLMGFNLYSFAGPPPPPIGLFLTKPAIQYEYFTLFLARVGLNKISLLDLRKRETRNLFARRYNGPGNVLVYADKIKNLIENPED